MRNTIGFEKSVLSRLLTESFHRMSDPALFRSRLVKPEPLPDYFPGSQTFVSKCMVWGATVIRPADVLFADDMPIWVLGAMVVDDEFFLVYNTLNFVGAVAVAATRWVRGTIARAALDSVDLRLPAAWHLDGDGVVVLSL